MHALARTTTAGLLVLTFAAAGAGTAQARGGDDTRVSGRCSAGAVWKLKVKPDDGRLEVEAEIDSNRNGQRWAVRLRDNGALVFRGVRTTHAPSGSFEVERRTADRAGRDRVTLVAVNLRSGERCSGVVVR